MTLLSYDNNNGHQTQSISSTQTIYIKRHTTQICADSAQRYSLKIEQLYIIQLLIVRLLAVLRTYKYEVWERSIGNKLKGGLIRKINTTTQSFFSVARKFSFPKNH